MSKLTPQILNLFDVEKLRKEINWEKHETLNRSGSKIYDIYVNNEKEQRISLVYCAPGSSAKNHLHTGNETFLILDGEFEDDNGKYKKGDLVCYTEDSEHSWQSPKGALIYAVWGGNVISQVEKA
ncbi:cupin domain-containing protein [Vibrio spartinae]|uniref:ChrR Cupin-like domain protein n=1 Tax=Vibrio spartinae TaxID=1918945 RepID=A0A1N6MBT0_9VIBR|nr:cupin domain-containing protein [Vibrio spartinae]SIO96889.1 ChrR Cupin-like domain protein [Vibrio spartinae]